MKFRLPIYKLTNWIGFNPSRWLLFSLAFYLINLLLGPYSYNMNNNTWSILFILFFFMVFFASIFIGEHIQKRVSKSTKMPISLSKTSEVLLLILMVIFLISGFFTIFESIRVTGLSFNSEFADSRHKLDELTLAGSTSRTTIEKIANGLVLGSSAPTVIVYLIQKLRYQITPYLALGCILLPIILVFLQGGRNGAVFNFFLFGILMSIRKRHNLHPFHGIPGMKILGSLALIFAIYLVFGIFFWRMGLDSASDLDVIAPFIYGGTSELKLFYYSINELLSGVLSPLYKFSYYYSHSIPFFSALFTESNYTNIYWGALSFRIYTLTIGGGTEKYLNIIKSQDFYGLYPTAAQGLLLDFGIAGSIISIIVIGFLFGYISRRAYRANFYSLCLLPFILIATFISPIYYFCWGNADFSIISLLIIFTILHLFSFLTRTKIFTYNR